MPRHSYHDLQAQLLTMQMMVNELSVDPAFGVTTRAALKYELPRIANTARCVIFMDIDNLHTLNEKYSEGGKNGYEVMNGKIKRAIHVRAADCMLRARWFSGDELVFILSSDNAEGFCSRLAACLKNEGITATFAWVHATHNIERDIEIAGSMVQAAKRNNRRNSISFTCAPAFAPE